jgi:acyl dehydratase
MTTLATVALLDRGFTAPTIGKQYISNWFLVTQNQIDAFAEATGDKQWIHTCNVEQKDNPFGAPIAHGLLLVSLAINLTRACGALPQATWVLYGFDKLRFRAPVRSGTRIRCLTIILGLQPLGGRQLMSVRLAIEIEGEKIPAITANCTLMCVNQNGAL